MQLYNIKIYLNIFIIIGVFLCVEIKISNAENIFVLNREVKSEYHINKYFDLVPSDKNGNKKVVLITIDDGPTKRTPEIMKILSNHNAKAIFFINGISNKKTPDVLVQITQLGFTVGNHAWSHLNLKKEKNIDIIKSEIIKNNKLITDVTGTSPRFFRPPYGATNAYIKDFVRSNDMILMNWSGSALDWEKSARDEKILIKNVTDHLHDGEILLIHEYPWTVKYLDNLLTAIEEKGYTFIDPNQITR